MSFTANTADRLAAAKLWLISAATDANDGPRDLPYLAHALYALVPVPCTEVAKISTDEHWRLYINENWLSVTPIPEVAAELAHLTWHLLHDHAGRARDLHVNASTAMHWKNASDASIEATLHSDQLGPVGMPKASDFGLPEGRSAEEYYASLSGLPVGDGFGSGEAPEGATCGSGCDGLPRPHELPPNIDLSEVGSEDARQIRHQVAIAFREHVTARGTAPGDAGRWAKEILEPTIAWEPLLASAVRRAVGWANGRTEYTYTKRSRRQSALPNVVLPGTRRPVPNIAFVIDTSGSVDDKLLGRALGEVDGALAGLGVSGSSVTVLSCDSAVNAVRRVRSARESELAGGGGTDMRVGIQAAASLKPRPDLIVVFTDGYTPWPAEPPPGSSVIAALLGRHEYELPPTPEWTKRIACTV